MSIFRKNYWANFFLLRRGNRLLRPLNVTYYLTTQCNLNCIYCEDFGAARNERACPPLPYPDAQQVLRVIRTACDHLILTGGEPLLVPYIYELVAYAKKELGFKHLTMLTNASLLERQEKILTHIDRLVVSLDSANPVLWSSITQTPISTNQTILDNLRKFAPLQRLSKFQLVANCVITPQTLDEAETVLEFCIQNHISISFSPQSVNNWPHFDLLTSEKYQAFISRLILLKKRGAPVLASLRYLDSMRTFSSYSCYPLLVPRIWPDGKLIYPCRPIEKAESMQGGRPCSLLEVKTWEEAMRLAQNEYGQPPRVCSSCYQQCYAEPSLMQTYPFSYLREMLFFQACRHGDIASHAPG